MDLVFVQPEAPDVRIPGNHDGDGLVPSAAVREEIPHQPGMASAPWLRQLDLGK